MSEQTFILAFIAMVIAVPITIGVGADIIKRWMQMRERQMDRAADRAGLSDSQAAQIERLEERVRVLERIATDQGVALAAEIDSLHLPPRPAVGQLS